MGDNCYPDVAEILRQLKQEVREQYREGRLAVSLSRVAALEQVHATSWVDPHRPIAWPHWPKGIRPKLMALAQKVTRRLLRWYITPIVEDQNRFNAAVVEALDVLAQENAQLACQPKERPVVNKNMNTEDIFNKPYSELATREDIYHCYRLILGRNPDEHGWRALTSMIGQLNIQDLVLVFLTHPEFKNRKVFQKMMGEDQGLPAIAQCEMFKMYVSPNDTAIGLNILNSGVYEPHLTNIIKSTLKPGMVFLDLGANIGYFSILAAKQVGKKGRAIAFEPNQRNCALLQMSVLLNRLDNVDIYPFAVGDANTTVVYDPLLGSNGIVSREVVVDEQQVKELAHKTLVRSVKLDDVLKFIHRLDVVKLDIEGAEYRAILGAESLIKKYRPIIFSEYSPGWLPQISGVSGRDYLKAITNRGYSISVIEPKGTRIDFAQDVDKVIDYFDKNAIDHIDIAAYPLNVNSLGS